MDYFEQSDQLKQSSRRVLSGDSNLIPLINVVFLLLIFFMVAGKIQSQDGQGVQPPLVERVDSNNPPIIDVQINRKNEIFLEGELLSEKALREALKGEQYAGLGHLVIKVDRNVQASTLGTLLEVLRASGIPRIRLMTQASGE